MTAALDEYIQRRKRQKILSLFGTIDATKPTDTSANAVREAGSLGMGRATDGAELRARDLNSLPATPAAGTNGNTPSGKFCKQQRNSRRRFAVARHDHGPFQIFSKFFCADLPLFEGGRLLIADLDDGPVPRESHCGRFIWYRSAQDEVVVSVHQDADHTVANL